MTPSEVQELLLSFQKAVIERTMAAEMNLHLDYRPARCAGPVGRADRGGQDILIAVVDGLKGLTDAIGTAFPRTTVQTGIVHLIRNSLDDAGGKDRKAVAALRPIYAAAWQRTWENVTPFFVFPPDIRRVIDTTNAIEIDLYLAHRSPLAAHAEQRPQQQLEPQRQVQRRAPVVRAIQVPHARSDERQVDCRGNLAHPVIGRNRRFPCHPLLLMRVSGRGS